MRYPKSHPKKTRLNDIKPYDVSCTPSCPAPSASRNYGGYSVLFSIKFRVIDAFAKTADNTLIAERERFSLEYLEKCLSAEHGVWIAWRGSRGCALDRTNDHWIGFPGRVYYTRLYDSPRLCRTIIIIIIIVHIIVGIYSSSKAATYTHAHIYTIHTFNIRTDSRLRPSHDKSAISWILSSVHKYYNNIQFDYDNGAVDGRNWVMSVYRSKVGWADLPFGGETDVFNRLA